MGENKKYFWLKLYNDFFSSKRIKRLRSLAGGDTYTIIYLKMQLKALKDDGYLYFDDVMDDFAEELALDIDENADDVRVTIQYLSRVGLLESSENGKEYFLPYVQTCIGSETASAQRVRNYRARKKEQEALPCNTDETPMKQIETKCNTEIEKEKELETDIEIEKNKYQLIADMYNNTCVSFPRLTKLSDSRKKAIGARLKKYSLEEIQRVFDLAEKSDFLKGNNSRNWNANFDWLMNDANMAKVLDGNYTNKPRSQTQNNFSGVDDDFFRRRMGL